MQPIFLKLKIFYINNKSLIVAALLLVIVYKLFLFVPAFLGYYYFFAPRDFAASSLLDFWYNWDAGHYLSIAENGYNLEKFNMAFFPLYPLLIKLFSYLFGFKLAAYFINSLALWGVIVGLFKLVKIDFKENLAWRTIFYLLLFPTAVFLTAFYTESLFLFFTVWSFYFARRQKWKFAGGVSFFATLTRIEGLAVVVFLLYEYLALKKFSFKKLDLNLVYVLSPLAGIGLYAIYLKIQFGDALLFLKSQAAWDKSFSMPWESVINYMTIFFSSRTTGYYISRDIDLIFFLVFLILSIVVFFRLRKSYGVYSLFSLFMVTFTGDLISTNRRAIILFPVLILLARWGRGVIWNFAVLILFSTLFSFFLFKFINGHWVG